MIRGYEGVLQRIDDLEQKLAPRTAAPASDGPQEPFAASLQAALGSPDAGSGQDRYAGLIRAAAARYGVDERLVHAVVGAESDYDPKCVSSAGAMGLMQLMPENCRELGVSNPFDPAQNIDGGVRHLKQMLNGFGRLDLALAAYNAGRGAVRRYGGVPPYRETQAYVNKILSSLGASE
jgi:peptidoglycan DL-endopeptidase CwlO